MKLFNLEIFDQPLKTLDVYNKGVVNTLNAYSLYLYHHNIQYYAALNKSNIILPDGQSVCVASWLIHSNKLRKISVFDSLIHSLTQVNQKEVGCFSLVHAIKP